MKRKENRTESYCFMFSNSDNENIALMKLKSWIALNPVGTFARPLPNDK